LSLVQLLAAPYGVWFSSSHIVDYHMLRTGRPVGNVALAIST
jgi:hypothetical protein